MDGDEFLSQHDYTDGLDSLEHERDGVRNAFSQHGYTAPGMEFFAQANSSAVGHGVSHRHGFSNIDLNSQADEFPNLSQYRDVLQGTTTPVLAGLAATGRRRGGKSGRNAGGTSAQSAGQAAANARAPSRAPETTTAHGRGRRGHSLSTGVAGGSAAAVASSCVGESEEQEDETHEDDEEIVMRE